MSSVNKLSLKQFVKTEQSSRHQQIDNGLSVSQQTQQKSLKNEKRQSLKQGKKLKLNTLPCESTENQKQSGETFLFRSTWEDDMEHFKQQIKGCTSPTFATEILSHAHNHSNLFHANDKANELGQETSKRNRMSNSRSKSRHNKSLQKFIGDNISTHRPSNSMVEKVSRQIKQQTSLTSNINNNEQQKLLYDINKLQSQNYELKRQNKKTEQKYLQLKQKYQQLEQQLQTKYHNETKSNQSLMSNEQLLERMRNQSFWKFYLKAQKMIRSSITEGNHQSAASPINFMKELEALRELTSSMKKENKSLKKVSSEREEEVETNKDKLSIQEAQIEEMRLKCVAYESSIKRLREEISKSQKQLQKLCEVKELQMKLSQKSIECSSLSKQLNSITQQLQEQKLLNSECQKQRLSAKKKCQQLNDQVLSLGKQLSAVKTSYNLLEMEKQELSANKRELIEKEKLKEKVYQLQKEVKSITLSKEQQVSKIRNDYESRFGKQIEVKDSRVKELDQKVEKILSNLEDLQSQNTQLSEENRKLSQQINQVREYNSQIEEELEHNEEQLSTAREQKETKLLQLSEQLETLTAKLQEQSSSLLNQEGLIQQLKKQVNQKEELLKVKDYESQQLKASLVLIKEQQSSRVERIEQRKDKQINNQAIEDNRAELEDYITKLEEKHNQALELYETVHNEKVELQLQLQYYQNYVQKLQGNNNQPNCPESPAANQETLQLIESLLTIKEEIIKKILVFCPADYKQLLVQYIYYGDMIKEKYLQIINTNHENEDQDGQSDYQNNQSEQDSYLHQENYEENISRQNRTTRNHQSNQPTKYNKTKPYQNMYQTYDADHSSNSIDYPQDNTNDSKQEQINQLLEHFIKIGKIIDEETNPTCRKRNTQNQLKKGASKQKYDNYRNSKESQMHQFKNSINKKINSIKLNTKVMRPFQQLQQKYPSKLPDNNSRKPLQEISQKAQYSISRPLFTSNNIKSNIPPMKNMPQEEAYPNRPCFYQQPKQTLRSMNTPNPQVSYQKEVPLRVRNNFNHGVSNKLNLLKMTERLKQ